MDVAAVAYKRFMSPSARLRLALIGNLSSLTPRYHALGRLLAPYDT
jgi:hypothetical protein